MRLTVLFKHYKSLAEPYVTAYINDYHTVGSKPWGGGNIFAEVDMPDGEADVEIWCTKRTKGYNIEFAAKVNDVPVGYNADYVFNAPEDCVKLYDSFRTGIYEVPEWCKKYKPNKKMDKELESDGRLYRMNETR